MEFLSSLKSAANVAKSVGGTGSDLAGSATKFVGRLAVECAKYAMGSAGLKLTESDANTTHRYCAWTLDDLRTDRDYMEQFKAAMCEIIRKREKYDDYIGAIARWAEGKPRCARLLKSMGDDEGVKVTFWRLFFDGIEVLRETDVATETRSLNLALYTPNAKQLAWDGAKLEEGYEVKMGRERGHNVVKPKPPPVDSFLGIRFLTDYTTYVDAEKSLIDCELGIGIVDTAQANKLLDFDIYHLIVACSELSPEMKDKIIGIVCTVGCGKLDDVEEFMKKVRAIFEHKYQMMWQSVDKRKFFDFGPKMLYTMNVPGEISGQRHNVCISMARNEGKDVVELKVVVEDIYNSVHRIEYQNTSEYKDKKKRETEEAEGKERKRKEVEERARVKVKARIEAAEKAKSDQEAAILARQAAINDALKAL